MRYENLDEKEMNEIRQIMKDGNIDYTIDEFPKFLYIWHDMREHNEKLDKYVIDNIVIDKNQPHPNIEYFSIDSEEYDMVQYYNGILKAHFGIRAFVTYEEAIDWMEKRYQHIIDENTRKIKVLNSWRDELKGEN